MQKFIYFFRLKDMQNTSQILITFIILKYAGCFKVFVIILFHGRDLLNAIFCSSPLIMEQQYSV